MNKIKEIDFMIQIGKEKTITNIWRDHSMRRYQDITPASTKRLQRITSNLKEFLFMAALIQIDDQGEDA